MDLALQNKVFLVTGGSEGIGEAITRQLVAEGARVLVASKSAEPSELLARELNATGHRVALHLGDLVDWQVCQAAVEAAIAAFGQLDGLVNNAGVNDGAGLQAGPEAFRASLGRNLTHAYDLMHFALPHLRKSRGAVVNIASKVALRGQGGTSGYAAAKGGLLALTREWATELAADGIRVNAVLPAEVMTPLYRRWLDNTFEQPALVEEKIKKKIPLEQRMTSTEEISSMVLFLLSEQSSHTTGQWMVVDGGLVHLGPLQA